MNDRLTTIAALLTAELRDLKAGDFCDVEGLSDSAAWHRLADSIGLIQAHVENDVQPMDRPLLDIPFGPEELRLRSRDEFVGNECDTDQYRETQPMAGLTRAADLLEYLYGAGDSRYELAWSLFQTWVAAAGHSYEGADEATPLYELSHDVLWERGLHPYYGDVQELIDWLAEMDEATTPTPEK